MMTDFAQELEIKCVGMEEASHQIHLSLDSMSKQMKECDQRIGEIIDQVRDYHINKRPENWYVDGLIFDFKKQIKEKFGNKVYFNESSEQSKKVVYQLNSSFDVCLLEIAFGHTFDFDFNVTATAEEDLSELIELINTNFSDIGEMKCEHALNNLVHLTNERFEYQIVPVENKENIISFDDREVMAQVKKYIIEELLSPQNKDCLEIGLVMMDDEGKLMTEYEEWNIEKNKLRDAFDPIANRLTQSIPPALLSIMFKAHLNRYTVAFKESRELIDRKKKYDRQRIEITDLINKMEGVGYLNSTELDNLKGIQKRSNDELNQLLEEIRDRKEMVENFVRSPAIKDFKKVMRESLNMVCQICFQNKIDRSLKCGHLFCHDCLNKMKRGTSITCAFCNQISSTSNCGRCSENTIRNIYLSSGGTD